MAEIPYEDIVVPGVAGIIAGVVGWELSKKNPVVVGVGTAVGTAYVTRRQV